MFFWKRLLYASREVSESLVVDLQGLSKMIKENYFAGNSVKDDMLNILGFSKGSTNPSSRGWELRGAVLKLLQGDLGLEVLLAGPRFGRTVSSIESRTCGPLGSEGIAAQMVVEKSG